MSKPTNLSAEISSPCGARTVANKVKPSCIEICHDSGLSTYCKLAVARGAFTSMKVGFWPGCTAPREPRYETAVSPGIAAKSPEQLDRTR